jgi:acyl-coenzyme A thioesterase PaaI-like protein
MEKKSAHGARHKSHAGCVACGHDNPAGLRLRFVKQADGSVRSAVFCRREISGYAGFLHGGVAALMLDSAMTNCLFSLGVAALTAEFNLKYKAPVMIGRAAELRAWLVSDMAPLYLMKADLSQDGRVKVLAEAKFLKNTFLED